jgi:hypothetical protein
MRPVTIRDHNFYGSHPLAIDQFGRDWRVETWGNVAAAADFLSNGRREMIRGDLHHDKSPEWL